MGREFAGDFGDVLDRDRNTGQRQLGKVRPFRDFGRFGQRFGFPHVAERADDAVRCGDAIEGRLGDLYRVDFTGTHSRRDFTCRQHHDRTIDPFVDTNG